MKVSWFLVILLLVLVAVFSVQNAEPITVKFITWQVSMSAALVIQLAALLGALVGLTIGALSRRASRVKKIGPAAQGSSVPPPESRDAGPQI